MPNLADFHMHTHHSGDSKAPMEDMIRSAMEKGLLHICFTDHLDLNFPDCYDLPPEPFTLDIDSYSKELTALRKKYEASIKIGFGIEIGMQSDDDTLQKNKACISSHGFDFVIASIHLMDHKDPYYPSFWEGSTQEEIISRTFDVTLENSRLFDDYDVLGHLDYVVRYAPGGADGYSYEKYKDKIDPILEHLVAHGKGLDFNSKVLGNDPEGTPNPCPEIIKRFNELGGRIITFGSDAHTPEKIACGFERMRALALNAGFTEYYTFEGRKPVAHSL